MTDSTDRVLVSIDEAIDGYVTWDGRSGDAMRWTAKPSTAADMAEAAARAAEALTLVLRPQLEAMNGALISIGKLVKRVVEDNHPAFARMTMGDDFRRHRIRCRLCNPAGNPKPLAVNGAEYRRRTRSRRRRNRR